ncbi:cobalamin biosynthesis protein [Rheinheimera muenzenbergensis]|uniref:Cobalamin biosynthesis protein n=1 Tax=Rheinheimera muenzenbergensis TaxID=1193628 RepID=A0ABU8C487_9GAMM
MLYNLHWPQELWLNPLLLLVVVLASVLLPLPAEYHPLTLYRYFARALGHKVNPDPNRPRQQLYISGTLALLVATVPLLALVYSLLQFSELPQLFDALLLFACLDWQQRRSTALQIQQTLQRNQLALAREQAAALLLRRRDNLTSMGLSKALCESLILRSSSEVIATLLWFLVGGGLAALSYRLLLVLQQQWNSKTIAGRHFGRPVSLLVQLLSAPALLFSCISLALHYGIRRCWRLYRTAEWRIKQQRRNFGALPYCLLCCAAAALRRSLGGPVYYDEVKLSRSRITLIQEPAAADITRTLKLTRQNHLAVLTLAAVIVLLQLTWLLSY